MSKRCSRFGENWQDEKGRQATLVSWSLPLDSEPLKPLSRALLENVLQEPLCETQQPLFSILFLFFKRPLRSPFLHLVLLSSSTFGTCRLSSIPTSSFNRNRRSFDANPSWSIRYRTSTTSFHLHSRGSEESGSRTSSGRYCWERKSENYRLEKGRRRCLGGSIFTRMGSWYVTLPPSLLNVTDE